MNYNKKFTYNFNKLVSEETNMSILSKLVIPEDYGYVVLTGLGHFCFNAFLAFKVMQARKKYDVKVNKPLLLISKFKYEVSQIILFYNFDI